MLVLVAITSSASRSSLRKGIYDLCKWKRWKYVRKVLPIVLPTTLIQKERFPSWRFCPSLSPCNQRHLWPLSTFKVFEFDTYTSNSKTLNVESGQRWRCLQGDTDRQNQHHGKSSCWIRLDYEEAIGDRSNWKWRQGWEGSRNAKRIGT